MGDRRWGFLDRELLEAVGNGRPRTARALLRGALGLRADPDARDAWGLSALALAVSAGDRECVEALLEAGARTEAPDAPSWEADTPLCAAAERGRVDLAEALLAAGADPNAAPGSPGIAMAQKARLRGTTPLMRAAAGGSLEMAELLVSAGADAAARDAKGRSAEDWARGAGTEFRRGGEDGELAAFLRAERIRAELSGAVAESAPGESRRRRGL